MTTVSIYKSTAVMLVFLYTMMAMAAITAFPHALTLIVVPCAAAVWLACELTLCGGPKETESGDESAAEPRAKVAAVASLEAEVGEDADETGDNDEHQRHHHHHSLH